MFVRLSVLFIAFGIVAHAQQSPPPNPATTPIQIAFLLPVDVNNVNQLVQLINQQRSIGRKDFIILLSSQGGEVLSGLAAYNYLHGLDINLTTFNIGQVDSAANLIFCAGRQRYALPNSRFLVHSAFTSLPPGTPMNSAYLDGQLQQVKNMNQLSAQIIEATIGKKSSEIEQAIQGQNIFDPQMALSLGLIQAIKPDFLTPGAVIAEVKQEDIPVQVMGDVYRPMHVVGEKSGEPSVSSIGSSVNPAN